jgi:hypothetical protein
VGAKLTNFETFGKYFVRPRERMEDLPPRSERMERKKNRFYMGEHLTSLDNFIIKYLLGEYAPGTDAKTSSAKLIVRWRQLNGDEPNDAMNNSRSGRSAVAG